MIQHTYGLVSVIMPAYNVGEYIEEAISSVITQSYPHWELLIINDGSTDNTEQKIRNYSDERIKYFTQENKGVSTARNLGLAHVQGDFFCFLDADDVMPPESIKCRLALFEQYPDLYFADGTVEIKTEDLMQCLVVKQHTFSGNPFKALIRLDPSCFLGLTWMVRVRAGEQYRFDTGITHCEDLVFFTRLASKGGKYCAAKESILIYRQREGSAMSNLSGLQEGYQYFYHYVSLLPGVKRFEKWRLFVKIKKIMLLSFLAQKQFKAVFKLLWSF